MKEKSIRTGILLDFYGNLLTDRMREACESYYYEDLSLAEIAELQGISRQGVHDTIKRAEKELESYEDKLGLMGLFEKNKARAQKALDLASDGLMIECHINPDEALTDAKQQITPDALKTMLAALTFRSKQSCHVERDLAGWRGEIDDIDAELLQLLARRMEISAQIGEYKKQNNVTVVQMDRWKQVLDGLMATGQELGLSPIVINKVFEAIHQASIDRQTRIMEDE